MVDKTRLTAYHEAGHVIAHLECDVPFEYVTIEPTQDALGHVQALPLPNGIEPSLFGFNDSPEYQLQVAGITQRDVEAGLVVSVAGEAATYILTGERDDVGTGRVGLTGDSRAVFEWSCALFQCGPDPDAPEKKAADAYLEWLWWRAVLLLQQRMNWIAVEGVADALCERKRLTADECKDIILATTKRVLDEERSEHPLPPLIIRRKRTNE